MIACFQVADQDGSGFIDDKELQRALSSYNQSFGLRTVHLLMYLFTNNNTRKIGMCLTFYTLIDFCFYFQNDHRQLKFGIMTFCLYFLSQFWVMLLFIAHSEVGKR